MLVSQVTLCSWNILQKKYHVRLRKKLMKIPAYAMQKNCDAQLYPLCTKHCIYSHKMNILIFGNRTQENHRLFKMIVGILTTCHTQYTWDRSYYYYRYSALGLVWAQTRAQSVDWYSSGTLHPGQVLRGSLPLLSPTVLNTVGNCNTMVSIKLN